MRLRYLCLLAWLVVTTDPRPAPAALLDTLAGSSRVDLGLVPEPTDGLVPRRALVPDPSPGLTWRVQNEFPLHLRRGGREVGELSSMSQSWLADGRAGSGRWRAEAVLYQASGGFDRDRAPTQGDLSESTVQLGYELPLGHAWRLATGYRYGRERGAVVTADPDLRPSSSGLFEATRFSHRLSLGAQRQLGAVSLGAGAAWLVNDARMDTALRNIPAQVLLDQQGWQAAANAGLAVGRDWQIAVAGGYREVRNRDTVFVGGVQHGRAWPAAEEWRLGLEATGDFGPDLRWWGTLFHRDLRQSLAGNATALAPPIGALAGPRYRLNAAHHLYQSGLASGVVWQAGPRTRLHSALRYSRGRWRAGYSLAERSDPTAPEEIASSSRADYDVTAWLVTAGVEQRLGTLRAGVALSGGLVTAGDNLEQPGAPASGDGMVVSPGLPFSFWLGVPW